MPIVWKEHNLAYFLAPKAASTSVCNAIHEAAGGAPTRCADAIHGLYPATPARSSDFERCAEMWSFAVIRDPIERLLSAYQNRILVHGDLDQAFAPSIRTRLGAMRRGLRLRPSASSFFARLNDYVALSSLVRHHVEPIRTFIGSDLSYFNALYTMAELPKLYADLSARFGTEIRQNRLNTSNKSVRFEDLSSKARARMRAWTEGDYDLLGDYFAPPP